MRSKASNRFWSRVSVGLAALVGLLILALTSCQADQPLTTLSPKSDVTWLIQDLYKLIFWMSVVVFFIVQGALIFAMYRFRRRKGDGIPKQVHGNRLLEITWTIIPAIILLVIVIPTWQVIFKTADVPEGSMEVRVTGHQWWWEVEYPGLGVTTANEIRLPVDKPVHVILETHDVIHSFWVPQLVGKTDMMPGRVNSLWFTPTDPGTYYGQCVEFCGTSHANMRFRVVVLSDSDFDQWVALQLSPPEDVSGDALVGAELFATGACIACHTIEGTPGVGVTGPNLTHIGGRLTLAAGILDNTPEEMARWLRDPESIKPGSKMPNLGLTESEIGSLVSYLQSLK